MYRQIKLHPDHAKFQRIMWRFDSNKPIQHYQLNPLTYGTKPASYIATRCLKQLALENEINYPLASKIIRRDFYMDDLLTGASTIEDMVQLRDEIIAILASGHLNLYKWASNLNVIPNPNGPMNTIINFDDEGNTKTLGLVWNCIEDVLKYNVSLSLSSNNVTKRSILSTLAQISL